MRFMWISLKIELLIIPNKTSEFELYDSTVHVVLVVKKNYFHFYPWSVAILCGEKEQVLGFNNLDFVAKFGWGEKNKFNFTW